jgi:phage shock protein A
MPLSGAAQLQDQNKTLSDNLANAQATIRSLKEELDKLKAKIDEMAPKAELFAARAEAQTKADLAGKTMCLVLGSLCLFCVCL